MVTVIVDFIFLGWFIVHFFEHKLTLIDFLHL